MPGTGGREGHDGIAHDLGELAGGQNEVGTAPDVVVEDQAVAGAGGDHGLPAPRVAPPRTTWFDTPLDYRHGHAIAGVGGLADLRDESLDEREGGCGALRDRHDPDVEGEHQPPTSAKSQQRPGDTYPAA